MSAEGGGCGGTGEAGVVVVHGARVEAVCEVNDPRWDALVVVTGAGAGPPPHALEDFILAAQDLDKALHKTVGVVRCARVCGGRLVMSPVGALSPYDDVRSVGEAMSRGVARAVSAGARRICLYIGSHPRFQHAPLVALLAALEAIYVPLQIRESFPEKAAAVGVTSIGVYLEWLPGISAEALIRDAAALEIARGAARDVGGADPERMTPLKMAEYAQQLFSESGRVRVRVVDERAELEAQYPLLACVDRAAAGVPRHRGCVVFLEYTPETHTETAMLVGKGVTYDTGGCDVKAGGAMAGMSRDKCGAAAVLGFVKACEVVNAPVKVVAALACVRNSIGSDAYVADELVRTRRGAALRVGNTDAEGRMAMADLLAEMAVLAEKETQPHLYTVATLTGHAHRAYGPYTAAADNHVARALLHAERLCQGGEALGEPGEVSRVRREDLAAHAGRVAFDDIHQADSCPSTAVPRGHQGPAAFMLLASGLSAAESALPFTHLDVAGSAGSLPEPPTAAPLLALAARYDLVTYHRVQ